MAGLYPPVAEFEETWVRPRLGRTLIVGSQVYKSREDRRKRYPDVLGVDMLAGPGVDRVLDLEEDLPDDLGLFAHVECRSVLEHSKRPWALAANIERLMEAGATLHVAVPFIWRVHAYPSDYWRFTREGIRLLFPRIRWSAVSYAHMELMNEGKIPTVSHEGFQYICRTETVGFGAKE